MEDINFLAGEGDLSSNPRMALLAVCIKSQQDAGFKHTIDLREGKCSDCNASGFNTGWGVFKFTCGAEILTDGEMTTPCPETI